MAAHRDATEHAVLAALKTVARSDHYRVAYAGGREHGLTGAPLDAYADEFVTVARRVADKAAA